MSARSSRKLFSTDLNARKNKEKNARRLRAKDKDNQGRAKGQRYLVIKKENELRVLTLLHSRPMTIVSRYNEIHATLTISISKK